MNDEQLKMLYNKLDALQISSDRTLETLIRLYGAVNKLNAALQLGESNAVSADRTPTPSVGSLEPNGDARDCPSGSDRADAAKTQQSQLTICPLCEGNGKIKCEDQSEWVNATQYYQCPKCGGTGKL